MPDGKPVPERPTAPREAPGGVRRVLWGLALGAVLGVIGGLLSPRPSGPRRAASGLPASPSHRGP